MFVRLVYESFRRQKRRKLLAGAAITLGVTVATAMIGVATDIGDKINRELRTLGANLVVTPQEDSLDVEIGGVNLKPPTDGAFLNEADLPKIKGIFWHNNITVSYTHLDVYKRQTLAYLTKIGRAELRKTVYAALIAAFLGSIGVAVVISRTHLNEDIFEGWIMLVAAFFVVTMVIFMMKTGRKLKGEIEGKVGLLAGNDAWFGLFVFIFLMVLREGAETVLILSAVSLNSTELMSFLGTLLGVLAAIAFGVMFVKGSVRINLQKFFRITTAILFLVAAQLVLSLIHI